MQNKLDVSRGEVVLLATTYVGGYDENE